MPKHTITPLAQAGSIPLFIGFICLIFAAAMIMAPELILTLLPAWLSLIGIVFLLVGWMGGQE